MSLSSSLNAGVAGLSVNSTRLAVISDNIANSSTNGYRRSDVDFSSLVTESNGSSYTAGGVTVQVTRDVAASASLTSTGSSTDISVAGSGFLPATTSAQIETPAQDRDLLLVPTGSFSANDEGYLVTPSGPRPARMADQRRWHACRQRCARKRSKLRAGATRPLPHGRRARRRRSSWVSTFPALATDSSQPATGPFNDVVEYFDPLGKPLQLNVVYTPNYPATGSTNEWLVSFYDSATSATVPISEYTVVFDASVGSQGGVLSVTPVGAAVYDGTTGIGTINVAHGPITVLLGASTVEGGLTQLAAEFAPVNIIRNGAPAGSLTTLEFDENGFLNAVYDTGQRRTLYQIPIGAVNNPNELNPEDNQSFSISPESGDVFFWDAGSGPVGTMASFALQESTVDVAQELTRLITTQRAYSSNATVIRTVDEMLQETTNLKR